MIQQYKVTAVPSSESRVVEIDTTPYYEVLLSASASGIGEWERHAEEATAIDRAAALQSQVHRVCHYDLLYITRQRIWPTFGEQYTTQAE